jgi:HEAT repeat protein
VIAAAALGERQEPRALVPLKAMASDPDPYLAAAAVRALAHYSDGEVMDNLQMVAEHGPAPARRVARRLIARRHH